MLFLHLALALYRDYTTHKIYEGRKSKHVIILLMKEKKKRLQHLRRRRKEREWGGETDRDRKRRNGTRVGQIIRAQYTEKVSGSSGCQNFIGQIKVNWLDKIDSVF